MKQNYLLRLKKFGSLYSLIFEGQGCYFIDRSTSRCWAYDPVKGDLQETRTPEGSRLPLSVGDALCGEFIVPPDFTPKEMTLLRRIVADFSHELELEDRSLEKELAIVESRFKAIFSQSPFSIQICSKDGKTLLVNDAWKKLWAIPEDVIQNYILRDYNMLEDPALVKHGVMEHIRRGYSGEVTRIPEICYIPLEAGIEGRARFVEGFIYPLKDDEGNVAEIVLLHTDVTEERETEKAKSFLAELSATLMTSLDFDTTVSQIAEACVPALADGFIIDIMEKGRIKRLFTKHKSLQTQVLLEELQTKFGITPDSPQPSARVMRSGVAEFLPVVDETVILSHTYNDEHARLISRIGVRSHIAVPLHIRGEVVGSINLMKTTSEESFHEIDYATATELGRRASIALENSQLYRNSQDALEQREDFISVASHELKTPITSMKLQFQVALRKFEIDAPEQLTLPYFRQLVERSMRQLGRLTVLVEDMLDISRIRSGKLALKTQATDVSKLVREVLERLAFELETLPPILRENIPPEIICACDPYRIEQVLTNLMTNAVRYGEHKTIEVSLAQTDSEVILAVKDEGPGISVKDQERIFERFERASSVNVGGLGLGLYISREIMESHRGSLRVESTQGLGSTFIATLPRV